MRRNGRQTIVSTTEDLKNALRALSIEEIIEDDDGNFAGSFRGSRFLLPKTEVEQYFAVRSLLRRGTETQVSAPGYYEHVIQFEGVRPRRMREDPVVLENQAKTTTIEVGRPSTTFCLMLTDVDTLSREFRRVALPVGLNRVINPSSSRGLGDFFRFSTIQLRTDPQSALGRAPTKMHELAEAAAFHVGYGRGISISFTKSWERTYYWLGRKAAEAVQFPLRTYNSELVSYYSLALSSDSLVLGYLALYKILEYFYTSASETALHGKLRDVLVAPDFLHTKPKKLRELAKAVRQFDNKVDELATLRLVLSSYFSVQELRDWLTSYESENGQHFTCEVDLFSNKMRVDTANDSIVPNIASRIYTIRNALVHNKEGEVSRFIPFSGQEEMLQKEVPLLLFLAEQLIIKTGKDVG